MRKAWPPMTGPVNTWAQRFGAKRAAIDRALLAECERALDEPQDASKATQTPKTIELASSLNDDQRARIARAFGRAL
jgi:hypothetical protein